ncbi:MAG: restriction endonuclease [Thermodesulfobacteriota bacterium]
MSSTEEYVARITSLNWDGLQSLWQAIRAGNTPDWPPGKALEYLILRAFHLDGADVTWPFEVQIARETVEQIDGIVYDDGLTCLLECKDTAEPVNVEPIAKLRNQLLRRPAGVLGALISRSGFTAPARTLAQFLAPQAILLWEGAEVGYVLEMRSIRSALRRKYRHYIEQGAPDYNLLVETIS